MTLTLEAHTEELIQHEIDAGTFTDPSTAISRAVELLHAEGEEARQARADLDRSWEQIQRREGIPGDQIEAMIAARLLTR